MKKFKLIKWVDEATYMSNNKQTQLYSQLDISIYILIYIYIYILVWLVYYSLYESALQEIRADIC